PAYLDEAAAVSDDSIPEASDLAQVFMDLVARPNLASKRPVYEQYDTEVGLVRIHGPGGDGGVVRIPGTNRAISVSADCNSRFVYLEPSQGAALAVAESARNVAVTGARPLGITNCLNFGNPYIPENYYMFAESIAGMSEACRSFEIPVTGGNVSFYNESQDGPVLPTPTIGMVGLISDLAHVISPVFATAGLRIALIGRFQPSAGGSEYQNYRTGKIQGRPPALDLDLEKRLCDVMQKAAVRNLIHSARDVSLGGLAVGLFRALYNPYSGQAVGATIDSAALDQLKKATRFPDRKDLFWFSETAGSILVALEEKQCDALQELCKTEGIPYLSLGSIHDEPTLALVDFQIDMKAAAHRFENGLVSYFE
ncbi:MAG: phosphoribosylformylglycinamidine synthase subunit PurL, partial [Leptospiraceae bacterium]|nr:phosphoribosylformylglycinamidine synthase subunit PurL [Leptospiraceae bacterium]